MPQVCSRCKTSQELAAFVDGAGIVRVQCETCRRSGRKRFKAYYRNNAPAVHTRVAGYRSRNKAAYRAGAAARERKARRMNPAKKAAKNRAYRRRNPGRVAALSLKRLVQIARATPAWADRAQIEKIYARAARLRADGHDVHVDHRYPLRGRCVSGLHVPGNLRIVSRSFNLRKNNAHDSDD